MNKNKSFSNVELIYKGYLWVNIPSILIILLVWFYLVAYLNVDGKLSAIIGGALGWIYWEFLIIKWVKWAIDNNTKPDRLLIVGQLSLLLWNRKPIDKVLKKMI